IPSPMPDIESVLSNRAVSLRWCAIILAAAGVIAAVVNLIDVSRLAALPFEMNYEEGNILNAGVRILHGLSPYPDPHVFPNVLNPYGPVFYYVTALAVRLGGVSLLLPRVIVIVCALIAAAAIGLLLRLWTKSLPLAFAGAGLFLASPLTYFWMPLLRVDFLALAFALIGLYFFARERLWWSIPFLALAFFVKVSSLAAPAACLLFLLFRRDWKRAIRFALVGIATLAIGFSLAQWLTQGWFSFHQFSTHGDPFSWRSVVWNLRGLAALDLPQTILSLCFFVMTVADRKANLPSLYLLFATAATVTSGKLGSDSNHLLELHATLTLCALLALQELAERVPAARAAVVLVACATAWLVFVSQKNPKIVDERAMLRDCGQVYGYVQDTQGDVLADNVGMLVLTGKPVFVSNPFVLRYLVDRGLSDQQLRDKIATKGFSTIILSGNPMGRPFSDSERWSSGALAEIKSDYKVIGHAQCTEANTVLVPQ
ncbi:MAG: DUF2029 domain-containing protein, partial [Acidobacteria bacterium]|nr:DUF2029 domain-containing protein [Acidobacteriota bacterium]